MIRLLIFAAIGALAGWLAGRIIKGGGFGFILNMILGIVGSFIGAFIFRILRVVIPGGFVGTLVSAFVGAVLLLVIGNLMHRTKK